MRMNSNTADIIKANEENLQVENGRGKTHFKVNEQDKFWKQTWIDSVAKHCKRRKIEIKEKHQYTKETTENATVIDYVCTHIHDENNKKELMRMINHVSTHKQIYLPFELVSICRMNT